MPVNKTEMHSAVGQSISWATGSLGLYARITGANETGDGTDGDQRRRRRQRSLENLDGEEVQGADFSQEASGEGGEEIQREAWEFAMDNFLDTLTTLACALTAVRTTAPLPVTYLQML